MNAMDVVSLLATAILGLLVVIALFRKPKDDGSTRVAKSDDALREARENAAKFEALAGERKQEMDRLNGDLSKLRGRLETGANERQELSNTISRLQAEMKAERETSDEKIRMLSKLRDDMEAKFKDIATEALDLQGEKFSKSSIERLQATLAPYKEHLGHLQNDLKDVHKETIKGRAALKEEIARLGQRSEAISQEAVALTRALKSDRQRQGAWGEMVLESILERSGLRAGSEYETQAHRTGEDGERLRPDVVVNIPGGKTLVIDRKVSLVAYTETVSAASEADADRARKRHVASLKGHINDLAARDYQNAEDSTVDYVIMFVPIEGALSEAFREDGLLTEFALERNVTIATPTTLMMALRKIANVWAAERLNRNAEEIAARAGRLYDKVAGFVENMQTVGKRIGQAQDAYEDAFGQLSRGRGNVLSQVETLKTLGARTGKSIGVDFEDADGEVSRIEARRDG